MDPPKEIKFQRPTFNRKTFLVRYFPIIETSAAALSGTTGHLRVCPLRKLRLTAQDRYSLELGMSLSSVSWAQTK